MRATGNFDKVKDVDPMVALSDATCEHIDHWAAKLPPDRKRSAVIQGLMAAQEQNGGFLTDELIAAVALSSFRRRPASSNYRHSGAAQSAEPGICSSSQECLGSARCRERATFVSAKVAKTIARGHDGFGNFLLPQLSSAPAERRPRRTRASMRSDMRRLLRRSAVRLGVMHGAEARFADGHPWPALLQVADAAGAGA